MDTHTAAFSSDQSQGRWHETRSRQKPQENSWIPYIQRLDEIRKKNILFLLIWIWSIKTWRYSGCPCMHQLLPWVLGFSDILWQEVLQSSYSVNEEFPFVFHFQLPAFYCSGAWSVIWDRHNKSFRTTFCVINLCTLLLHSLIRHCFDEDNSCFLNLFS